MNNDLSKTRKNHNRIPPKRGGASLIPRALNRTCLMILDKNELIVALEFLCFTRGGLPTVFSADELITHVVNIKPLPRGRVAKWIAYLEEIGMIERRELNTGEVLRAPMERGEKYQWALVHKDKFPTVATAIRNHREQTRDARKTGLAHTPKLFCRPLRA